MVRSAASIPSPQGGVKSHYAIPLAQKGWIGLYRISHNQRCMNLEDGMPRDGSVGKETFAKVEALTKKGKSKTEAFAQVASETGRNPGTVAANYYRVARANGTVKPRPTRRTTRSRTTDNARSVRRTARKSPANGSLDQLANDLVASVQALAAAVKAQDQEVADLRDRLDRVRKTLA
jgi:hypothetical protein